MLIFQINFKRGLILALLKLILGSKKLTKGSFVSINENSVGIVDQLL